MHTSILNRPMITFSTIAAVLWIFSGPITADRILAVSTLAAKSHWNFMRGVLRALTDRGHNVTVFTSFLDGNRENYTEVDVSKDIPLLIGMDSLEAINIYGDATNMNREAQAKSRSGCRSIFENKSIKDIILQSDDKPFDVVITETSASECISSLPAKLGVPLIYVVTPPLLFSYGEMNIFGHVPHPAIVSHVMSTCGIPRTFAQRLINTVATVSSFFTSWYMDLMDTTFDAQPYDKFETVKPSIVFTNSHYIIESARPLPPNVIPISGIHLDKPKNIPKDILEFIENSPHGVILFTFGSIVTISTLPNHIQKAFMEAFAQLPQRVLLKYEGEMKDKPKNVMTKNWIPQRDVLLHPKLKLFVSHGGISGTIEAVDAGIPVLGFPLLYDQPRNVQRLVDAGMAISMDIYSVTKDAFLNSVYELINNVNYSKNAKISSEQFKDRYMSPEESVAYWTKYVIRHKGAPHLMSHAYSLAWYQYFLLDVMAVILIAALVLSYVIYYGLKAIRGFIFHSLPRLKAKPE